MIDEEQAWRLLRDAACHECGGRQRVVLAAGDRPAVTFERHGWRSEASVAARAGALFDALGPVAAAGRDVVIGQLGQSLDGRIATATGDSHYVTGQASRVHLHRLRALVDAVVVGAGTVVADDPQLTVRHVDGHSPVRVVLDPNARVPMSRRVFNDGAAATLHVLAEDSKAPAGGVDVERIRLSRGARGIAPRALLDALAARGLRRVLIEGGGVTVSGFLQADALDRLHVVVAPVLIGSGRPAVTLPEITKLSAARRAPCRRLDMDDDTLFDLDLSAGARDAPSA